MQTSERKVKKIIDEWLREHCIWYFKPVQAGFGAAVLDYICCWRGDFVALEAKAGTKVTGRQEAVMREIFRAGGTSWIIGSETDKDVPKEEIIERLEEIDAYIRLHQTAAAIPNT